MNTWMIIIRYFYTDSSGERQFEIRTFRHDLIWSWEEAYKIAQQHQMNLEQKYDAVVRSVSIDEL